MGMGAYAASKSGVRRLTEALAEELIEAEKADKATKSTGSPGRPVTQAENPVVQ